MTITGIILLILLGILFILVEIFFVPGVGFVGIVGFLMIVIGIYLAYDLNTMYGHYTLIGGGLASVILGYYAFKPSTWTRVGVKSNIEGKSQEDASTLVKVGDRGICVSRLAPTGKARFENGVFEVTSPTEFINEGSSVEIVKLEANKIIVKPFESNESA